MTSSSYFFRVEHDLLRSEAFKTLGGSAIKVYLVIGLYSDFGTDWAYPSIRTIASHAGLSRQTVIAAVEQLATLGILATNKAKGRSTAYRIIRQAPCRPPRTASRPRKTDKKSPATSLFSLEDEPQTGQNFLDGSPQSGPETEPAPAEVLRPRWPSSRPKQETAPKEDTTSIPIPGTPFRLTARAGFMLLLICRNCLPIKEFPTTSLVGC